MGTLFWGPYNQDKIRGTLFWGTLFWGPYNQDPTIYGTIVGSPNIR